MIAPGGLAGEVEGGNPLEEDQRNPQGQSQLEVDERYTGVDQSEQEGDAVFHLGGQHEPDERGRDSPSPMTTTVRSTGDLSR